MIALDQLRAESPGRSTRIHFNNAGAGLVPAPVLERMTEYLQLEATLGGYEAADARSEEIADFHAAAATLLGCRAENIAFASSATDAFSRALSAIPFAPGDVVLTTSDDFVSNQIAFFSLRQRFGVEIVRAPNHPDGGVDVEAMARLMRAKRPTLVSVTHIPTNSGLVQPVEEIGRQCRELDLLYLVDACQSIGQYPLDAQRLGCDFLTATCRKFLRGPRGSGLLYVSDRALAAGYEPLFIDMRGARWVDTDSYAPVASAARFEDWEFPYAVVIGAATAIRYALGVGIEAISERSPALGARLRGRLADVPGARILDRGRTLCAIVTFEIVDYDSATLQRELAARGVNSSVSFREYALLDFTDIGVESCVRLSPHYYNTEAEVDQVAEIVSELAP